MALVGRDGEVMDWSVPSSSAGSPVFPLSQLEKVATLERSPDDADMAAGGPPAVFFASMKSSMDSVPASVVGPIPDQESMVVDPQYHLQEPGQDKYRYSLEEGMHQPLSASHDAGQFSLEEAAALKARRSAKNRTFATTIILATIVGFTVLFVVYLAFPNKKSPPSPINESCVHATCDGFNGTEMTCRGALYSWCCSEVGGAVSCSFPEQRQLAWGAVLSKCPQCGSRCLQDTYWENDEMFVSRKSCYLD